MSHPLVVVDSLDNSLSPFPFLFFYNFVTDFDDTSHTDENDMMEAERQSSSGLDAADFATVGSRHSRKRRDSHHSDSESEEDELRSLDDFPVETTYVIQQEEEFGSVFFVAFSVTVFSLILFCSV